MNGIKYLFIPFLMAAQNLATPLPKCPTCTQKLLVPLPENLTSQKSPVERLLASKTLEQSKKETQKPPSTPGALSLPQSPQKEKILGRKDAANRLPPHGLSVESIQASSQRALTDKAMRRR